MAISDFDAALVQFNLIEYGISSGFFVTLIVSSRALFVQ